MTQEQPDTKRLRIPPYTKDAPLPAHPTFTTHTIPEDAAPPIDPHLKAKAKMEQVRVKNNHDQIQRLLLINQFLKDWIVDLLDDREA